MRDRDRPPGEAVSSNNGGIVQDEDGVAQRTGVQRRGSQMGTAAAVRGNAEPRV